MNGSSRRREVVEAYRRRAFRYDLVVRLFDVFARFGISPTDLHRQAVSALSLTPGDTVVDIGCGTALNFPYLRQFWFGLFYLAEGTA